MVRIPRIYHPGPLTPGTDIELDSKAARHIVRVLRLPAGSALTIFNGEGGQYDALLTKIEKTCIVAKLTAFNAGIQESPLHLTLAQGIARSERMDLIIQKAVELGVTHIIPLLTERTLIQLTSERRDKKLAHWRGIIISACEQCGRNIMPSLQSPLPFSEWIAQTSGEMRLLLDPSGDLSLQSLPRSNKISLLIGPEGGFSEQEKRLALAHGSHRVRMGPRTLRTETASISALTALQLLQGDLC